MTTGEQTVICGEVAEACICTKPPEHTGAHRCACGGSWWVDSGGEFQITSLPGTNLDWWDTSTPTR